MLQAVISIFVFPFLIVCNCKLYTINSTLNSVLSSSISSSGGPKYVSDNGKFAVDTSGEGSCAVYMVHSDPLGWVMPLVWAANYFLYRNWDNNNEVSSFEVTNDGNLILYFHSGNKYESFSHPQDRLLPNQTLKTGMSFTSGEFQATVDYNGMLVNSGVSSYKSKAWMFGKNCNSSATEVYYSGSHLRFSNGCDEIMFRTSNKTEFPYLPYLQLDPVSGEFVSFMHDGSNWVEDTNPLQLVTSTKNSINLKFANAFICEIPRGQRSVCSRNGSCTCVQAGPNDDYVSFIATDFWYIPGEALVLKEFGDLIFYGPKLALTYDACRSRCLSRDYTTDCLAFLHDNETSQCFFIPGRAGIYLNAHFLIRQQQKPPGDGFDGSLLVLIVPLVFLTAWIAALVCFLAAVVRKRMKYNPSKEIEDLVASMQGLPHRFSYVALETATRGFSDKLGSGGFGSVYRGALEDGRRVAVKRLDTASGAQGLKQFVTEVGGMGGISHVNVVRLCGFCIEATTTQCLLVYDLMPRGSLDKWLFESEKHEEHLTWQQRIDIAVGTAQGLNYLHEECSEPILHLDIKPQNILLDDKFTAKLADFGMAKLLESRDITQVHTCMRGTPGYMAPEWLTHFTATKKSDVFSYGMVLLELIGGRKNVDLSKVSNINERSDENEDEDEDGWYFPSWAVKQVNKGNLLGVVDQKVREDAGERLEQVRMIVHLALWCIQGNPSTRPSMQTVVQVLQGHLQLGSPPSPLALSSIFPWASYTETSSLT